MVKLFSSVSPAAKRPETVETGAAVPEIQVETATPVEVAMYAQVLTPGLLDVQA
jgi:hypothetical protein